MTNTPFINFNATFSRKCCNRMNKISVSLNLITENNSDIMIEKSNNFKMKSAIKNNTDMKFVDSYQTTMELKSIGRDVKTSKFSKQQNLENTLCVETLFFEHFYLITFSID
jgi:hypothetical protein